MIVARTTPAASVAEENPSANGPHVVVAGGGVAGLVTAWRLLVDPELVEATPTSPPDRSLSADALRSLRAGLRVTVVEFRPRLGGNIRSDHENGFVLEWGPNGYLDNAPETPRLCRLLGIERRVVPARDAAARRFLFVRGRLRPLPTSPAAFLFSDVLSLGGRLRVLQEPFVPGRPSEEESVFDFAARRIGREAASILVDAMVSGVYGGDSQRLSLVSAFPKLHALEKEHGGLVRGMIARQREARRERKASGRKEKASGPAGPGGVLTSFDAGMETLITELAAALRRTGRCDIVSGTAVEEIAPPPGARRAEEPAAGERWQIALEDQRRFEADAVVLAIHSRHAGALARPFDPRLCSVLQSIPDAPLVVVALAYARSDFPAPLDGFGFLIPRGQGPRSLGVLWDSSIYPNRAPEGMVLLRAMLGGAHDPEAIQLDDREILVQAKADLKRTMDLVAEPAGTWIFRHRHGIPQYTLGHPTRLRDIERLRARWPGLYLAGNSYRGISVNHCVEESIPLAREILAHLSDRTAAAGSASSTGGTGDGS